MTVAAVPKQKNPHWYKMTIYYCPLCGCDKTYRERRYDPKPERPSDRAEFIQAYDYCDAF